MYQPSDTSPLNDVPLGFGISALPRTIHMVRSIFVETTLTKPSLAWQALAKNPQKVQWGSCLASNVYSRLFYDVSFMYDCFTSPSNHIASS